MVGARGQVPQNRPQTAQVEGDGGSHGTGNLRTTAPWDPWVNPLDIFRKMNNSTAQIIIFTDEIWNDIRIQAFSFQS